SLVWCMFFETKTLRIVASQQPAARPAPVIVSSPPVPESSPEPEVAPDVTSLDTFIAWPADHSHGKKSRKSLEGRDIRWTGTLKKSLLGRFDLVQDQLPAKGSIRLVP